MLRILTLTGGLAGAAALSQYPEFAQQYTQRLAGQVDALDQVVADFDRSALDAGLTRVEALSQMTGTAFIQSRGDDMRATMSRHAVLTANLADLRAASPLQRILMPHRMADAQTLTNTWADFQPAVPVTVAGAAAAGAGGLGGWAIIAGLLAIFTRKRPAKRPSPPVHQLRSDPPLRRAETAPTQSIPKLMGETRP